MDTAVPKRSRLTGRVRVITGGDSVVGCAVAIAHAREGAAC
jgi:NAD(P)-dependent dehydrogenase (short-subunit alcohol dehydrogenase family)